ncbi:YbaB/EbfC family nucleoid-associated protein [soil metagenome]|jgi:DNA-binding YbaB/EbfC family protein|nr:YbaB/EbfC family nucleoid-associated protein [Euzebyaceae bacterium]
MGNMNQMMRQAQALQRKLQKAQEELADVEVEGTAGGGTVTAVVTCGGEFRSVTIDPDAVDPDDVEMLQDLVVAACNDALRRSKEIEQDRLGGLTGGLGLPPGLL